MIRIIHPTYERAKAHHETKEKPDPTADRSHAAISVAFTPEQAVGDSIDHEHGDGGEDSTEMENIPGVLMVTCRGIQSKPPPTEKEESCCDGGNFVSLFTEINVLEEIAGQ